MAERAPFLLQSCGKDKASKDVHHFSSPGSQHKCTKQIHIVLRLLAANSQPLLVLPVAMEREKEDKGTCELEFRDSMSEVSNQQLKL